MEDMKTKILISLGVILVLMGVGYAVLTTTLTINGTAEITGKWDIYISNIKEKTLSSATTLSTSVDTKTTASFSVDLEKPGSYAEYEVTVKNDGNLDAVLKAINGIDEANALTPTDIEYSIQGLALETALAAGGEIKFVVRVDFKSTATTLTATSKNLTLSLDFEQSTTSGAEPTPTVEPTPTPETYPKSLGFNFENYSGSELGVSVDGGHGKISANVPSATTSASIIGKLAEGKFEVGHSYEVKVVMPNAQFLYSMSGPVGLLMTSDSTDATTVPGSWVEDADTNTYTFVFTVTEDLAANDGRFTLGTGGTYIKWDTMPSGGYLGEMTVTQLS